MKTTYNVILALGLCLASGQVLSQPNHGIEKVGTMFDFWGQPQGIVLFENYAYVSASQAGIRIIDISEPNRPEEVAVFDGISIAGCLAIEERTLLVADQMGGIFILDLSNPLEPAIVDSVMEYQGHGIGAVTSMLYRGGYAYLSMSRSVLIIDLNDPHNPEFVFQYDIGEYISGIVLANNKLIACEDDSLDVFSVANPRQTDYFGRFILDGIVDPRYGIDAVTAEGDVLYISYRDSIYSIDISDFDDRHILGSVNVGDYQQHITIHNGIGYSFSGQALSVIDFRNPAEMVILSSMAISNWESHSAISDSWLYLVSPRNGMSVIDVEELDNPEVATSIGNCDGIFRAQVINDCLMLHLNSDSDSLSHRYDISDIAHPTEIEPLHYPWIKQEQIQNEFLYTKGDSGLVVYYVDDSGEPEPVSYVNIDRQLGSIVNIAIGEGFVLAATFRDALITIDIEDPYSPRLLGVSDNMIDRAEEMALVDRTCYIKIGTVIYAVNLTDLENPRRNSCFAMNGVFQKMVANENMLCLLLRQEVRDTTFVTIYDRQNPTLPQLRSRYQAPFGEMITDIAIKDEYLLLDCSDSLRIFDCHDLQHPLLSGSYPAGRLTGKILIYDHYWIQHLHNHLNIFDFSEVLAVNPEKESNLQPSTLFLSAFPNPFNSSTTISYTLPAPGHYAIDVIDIQGRLVTKLSDGWREAGSYREVLNGGEIASGQYVMRLNSNRESQTTPITMIK